MPKRVFTFENPVPSSWLNLIENHTHSDPTAEGAGGQLAIKSSDIAADAVTSDKIPDSSITAAKLAFAIDSVPAGTVFFYAGSSAPAGSMKANGAAVSRTTYADLFAAIGTVFGAGDGSTTFNLPDLRAEFIRGLDDGRGIDTGRTIGSAQADAFKSHTHTTDSNKIVSGTGLGSGTQFNNIAATNASTGGTETRPRNIALLACIKY